MVHHLQHRHHGPHTLGYSCASRVYLLLRPPYREMERYCQQHPGTYFFSRPLYGGVSAHPPFFEFGLLTAEGRLWVERFPNTRSAEEYQEIERRTLEILRG